MATKKTMTVAQLVRALGLHGKVGEKAAKELLAQLSATGGNGKQKHTLLIPGTGKRVGSMRKPGRTIAASGKTRTGRKGNISPGGGSNRAQVPPKKFRLVYARTKGVRQVKPPASKSSLGTNIIRDAVVTASIGE